MRELAQISFVREMIRSMLLRDLQYLLHPISVQGRIVGMLANILLPKMDLWC
jgi:hypothetical protein